MYVRYHIPKNEAPPLGAPISKVEVVRDSSCINCARCSNACIYKVHERDPNDRRVMAKPVSHQCRGCLRCVENCPQNALSVELSSEYLGLGSGVWTPQRIHTIWNEAWTGRIPVFGAGYRGRFAGPGYDSMWTDMSEIVRPTRDGIHGREYISTSVEIGKRRDHLEFGERGELLTQMPPNQELPIPMVIDVSRLGLSSILLQGVVEAARELGTIVIAPAEWELADDGERRPSIAPVIASVGTTSSLDPPSSIMELGWSPNWTTGLEVLKLRWPDALIGIRLEAREGVEETVADIARSRADFVHLLYDEQGKEMDARGRHSRDSLISINRSLASMSIREEIGIIAGGGLSAAEHIPKSLICGADALAIERAIKVALGCRACDACDRSSCPSIREPATADWAKSRVLNMIGAWRDQLLEVMGAMGIREARRLRGEMGRAIFYEEAEADAFAGIPGGG